MTVDYRIGDVRDVMATIPDGSVSLVASSPPFLALRSYLPAGHAAKHAEIGSEPDPATFLDTLLALTAEWGRVLAPWGSIAIELGDTYAGNNQSGWERDSGEFRREVRSAASANGSLANTARTLDGWPRPKCMTLIPQLYATSLAYGRNILTGQPSPAGQWLVRNVIVWHRPNPAVGALGDKVRPSTSYITVATRAKDRWFDLTAVRTPHIGNPPVGGSANSRQASGDVRGRGGQGMALAPESNPAGAPPLDAWFDQWDGTNDTWTLTTQPSSLAHYAMWPAKLAERLILMMCPREVCRVCGEPRRRIEAITGLVNGKGREVPRVNWESGMASGLGAMSLKTTGGTTTTTTTLGWSDCGHDNYRRGHVLDPFAGSGTTLAVADLHGRDATGIDFNEANRAIYPKRYDEVKRALFGTVPELPGQLDMFEATP